MNNLAELDWSVLDLLDDVDMMWGMIYKALLYEIDEMCPYCFVKIKKDCPIWFTNTLSEASRKRDILFNSYRRGAWQKK